MFVETARILLFKKKLPVNFYARRQLIDQRNHKEQSSFGGNDSNEWFLA